MEAARQRMEEGYVEDVACAIAATLHRRPFLSAAVLGGAVLVATMRWIWLDTSLFLAWIASGSFLAGAAIGARRRPARSEWLVGYGIGSGLAVAVVVAALVSRSPSEHGQTAWPTASSTAPLAVVGFAFLVGFGLRSAISGACAAVLFAMTLAPGALLAAPELPSRSEPGVLPSYAGWLAIVALLLVARRGRWLLALPFATALTLWHESAAWGFWDLRNTSTKDAVGFAEIFLVAGASVLLPVIAGRAAALFARDGSRDGVARLVVRVQRDPWRTALVAVLVATAYFRSAELNSIAHLLVLAAGMACLAHCVGSRSFVSLAPWTAAAVLSVPLSVAFQEPLKPSSVELTVLPEALVLYVPLVLASVVTGTRALRWPGSVLAAVLIAEAAVFVGVQRVIRPGDWSQGTQLIWALSWCAVVSLLVHSVATSDVSPLVVLVASPIVSFLVNEAFYGTAEAGSGWILHSRVVPTLLAGPAAALLGLAARRVRSMTALPADHPSFELPAAPARSLAPAPNP